MLHVITSKPFAIAQGLNNQLFNVNWQSSKTKCLQENTEDALCQKDDCVYGWIFAQEQIRGELLNS